jgi:hypothetical protein
MERELAMSNRKLFGAVFVISVIFMFFANPAIEVRIFFFGVFVTAFLVLAAAGKFSDKE